MQKGAEVMFFSQDVDVEKATELNPVTWVDVPGSVVFSF